MSTDYSLLLTGLALVLLGFACVVKWQYVVQAAIDSGNRFWRQLGLPQASENSRRVAGRIVVQAIGVFGIVAGLMLLFGFLTGRDWPLHYAAWKEIWPF
jgi:uncharacterized membrane protein YphA (DoxX/SURF4 family)